MGRSDIDGSRRAVPRWTREDGRPREDDDDGRTTARWTETSDDDDGDAIERVVEVEDGDERKEDVGGTRIGGCGRACERRARVEGAHGAVGVWELSGALPVWRAPRRVCACCSRTRFRCLCVNPYTYTIRSRISIASIFKTMCVCARSVVVISFSDDN